jgi:hypothetical protein
MLRTITIACLLLCALHHRPVAGQTCPNVDPQSGYPLMVSWANATGPDSSFLRAFIEAAAYRWRVPSRRRNAYDGWQRVRNRLLPPEPRWADDWLPELRHRATMLVTLHRDGEVEASDLEGSGDDGFDRSLRSIVDEPMPAAPDLPELPEDFVADSATLRISFGHANAAEPHAVIRFAAHQTPVRLVPGTLRVDNPPGSSRAPRATVKYDVTPSGTVRRASIEILRSSSRALSEAIQDGLLRARFEPATSNCRPIGQSVVQTFGR